MSLLRIKQADGSWSNIPAIKGADGIDGKDGAIQYTAGRYIQIDEDTHTINCTVKIGDLVIIDAVPVKDSTNVVSSGGVYDALETKADKTEISGLGSEAGFITNSVEDLKNYYKKSETYSQEEVNSLIGNLTRLTLQVVQELPETGTEHIIYLVPNNESGNNVFEEWIFVQSKWEMIGTTEVDLSNYYTKEEVDTLITELSNETVLFLSTQNVRLGSDNSNSDICGKLSEFFTRVYKHYNNAYGSWAIIWTDLYANMSTMFQMETGAFARGIGIANSYKNFTDCMTTLQLNITYSKSDDNIITVTKFNISEKLLNFNSEDPTQDYHLTTKKYVDDKILDAIPQKSEMPEASVDYLDKIYQYIGEDTEEFTKGFFYQCISETAEDSTVTYSWSELKFNTENIDTSNIQEFPTIDLTAYLTYDETGDYISVSNAGKEALSSLFTDYYKRHNTLEGFNFIIRSNKSNPRGFVMMMLFRSDSNSSLIYSQIMFPADLDINYMSYTHCYITYSLNDDNTITISRIGSWGSDFTNGLAKYRIRDNVLAKDNTVSFTPTSDYHPATKKYVDEAIANAGAGEGSDSDLSNYYTKEEVDALIPAEDELLRMPYIMVSYSLNNNDSKQALGKLFTEHYKKHNTISTLMFGMIDQNATYTKIFRWKNNGTGEGGVPTEVTFICLNFPSSNIESIGVSEYKWRFSFDADGNISIGAATITAIGTMSQSFLSKSNTAEFTPTADYHPATKKYVDEAVAAAGGSGEGDDLSNYYNKEEVDAKVAPLASAADVLTKTNTTEYTPASAYHPATKQYVDQAISNSGGITEESDPTVPLHVKNITQDMIAEWDSKLDATAVENMGFIKEESAFNGSAAKNITETDINYWDSKQDAIAFNSTYNAASNKAATMSDVKAVEDKIPEDIVFNTEYNATTNKAATMADVNAIGGQIPTVVSAFTNDAGYVQKDYDVINMEGSLGGASNNLWISQGSIPGPKTFKQILQERLTSVYKHYLTTNDTSKLPDINLKINYHITNYDSYTPEKGVLQDFSIIIDNSLLTTVGFYNSGNTEYIEQAPITQSNTTINLYYYLPCTKISGVPAPMKIRFLCKMTISSTGDVTISSMNLYPEGRFEELTYIITTTPYEIPVLHKSSSFQMPTISTGSTNNVPFYKSNLEAMPRSLAMFNGIKDNAVINSDPAWIPEGPILLSKAMLTDETNGWAYAFDLLYERLAAGLFKVSDILYDIGTSAKLPLKLMKYSKQTYSTTENYGYCGIHLDFYDAYPKSGREVYHLEIWVKIREQYAQSNTDEDRGEIVVVNDYGWETIQ